MLTPVNFDDQLRLQTDEVGDIVSDRPLSSEFCARHLTIAHAIPEAFLCISTLTAKVSRHVWRTALDRG
jgi:hypothetical protein